MLTLPKYPQASADDGVLSGIRPKRAVMTNWINTVSRDHVERGVRGRLPRPHTASRTC